MSQWRCGRHGLSTWSVLLQHKRSGFDGTLAVEGLLPAVEPVDADPGS